MTEKKFKMKRMDDLSHLFGTNTKAFLGDNAIVYTSRGSSSCPPIVEKVEQIGNEIHLTTKDYSGMVCTSDLRPVVQFIEYSNNDPIPRTVKIFLDGKQQN